MRIAWVAALTVAVVVALAATGGIGYAASVVAQAARAVKVTSAPAAPKTPLVTSACSQYAVAPVITSLNPSAAFAGSVVAIRGSHFAGASRVTSVRFSPGVSASFSVRSNTLINAIVPGGAVTGSVTVANCKGSASGAFTRRYFCKVPNLIGLTIAAAKSSITARHCTVGLVTKKTVGSPPHNYKVVSQAPAAGRMLFPPGVVSFTAKG